MEFAGPEKLSRLSTLFRIILMLPLLFFTFLLAGSLTTFTILVGASGGLITAIVFVHWITVLVRGRPVSWAWGTIVGANRFVLRSYSYFFLLTDRYPPFDGDWYLQYEVQKPARLRRRMLIFWKAITALPHFIVLSALWFLVVVCTVVGWFAILFTGRYPKGLSNFVIGWMRWYARVSAYTMSLRDEFPPYSLSSTAGPGSRAATLASATFGLAVVAGAVIGIVALVSSATQTVSADVDYTPLTSATQSPTIDVSNVRITLVNANDKYAFPGGLYTPDPGDRFVEFTASLQNGQIDQLDVYASDFHLDGEEPVFVSLQTRTPPRFVRPGVTVAVVLVFSVPGNDPPKELTYHPGFGFKHAKFVFH